MTAVPPPVPPEIVEKAAKALAKVEGVDLTTYSARDYLPHASAVLAAVYGDIVEAARRDALTEVVAAIREVAAEWADVDPYDSAPVALADALRVVTDLRDATAPPHAPTATKGDEQAVPRTPGTDGAQIVAEGFGND